MIPKLVIYRVADPKWGVMWNRYPTRIIGAIIITNRIGWSILWRRPFFSPSGKPIKISGMLEYLDSVNEKKP
jgi:hypothetical protein